MLDIISVGPGEAVLLTDDAKQAIDRADAVWCAARHAVLVPPEKARPLSPLEGAIEQMRLSSDAGQRAAVLVSGDAGLYSLLEMLKRKIGGEYLRVHPGVSALQLFAARLGVSWQDAKILSAHGRALSESALCHAVRTHRQTFCFLDAAHNPAWVRESLNLGGLENVRLFVGERLSYPDERTEAYDPDATYDPLCMAYIENDAPESGLPPVGLSDEAFIRGKTPMTKRDVRALVVSALHLKPNGVVWDIGAGTGSVSVECAHQCPLGEVYAVEMKDEALDLIRRNAERFHALNLRVVPGRALEVLSALPAPDAVFLGGTTGAAVAIVELLRGLQRPIRLVATAVTMESAQALLRLIETKSLSDITVTEVTKLAGVSRITFYRNYTELVDILFDYLEMQQFGLAQNPAAEEYLPQLIRSYFIFFHENRSLFQCIQTYNLLPRLYAALEAHLSSKAYLLISTYGFESPYEVSALTGMLSKILMDWIRSGMQESVEEMSSIVYNIITKYNCILIP